VMVGAWRAGSREKGCLEVAWDVRVCPEVRVPSYNHRVPVFLRTEAF
jgi:hypothetical protein